MRIAYTADLHGHLDGYRTLVELAVGNDAEAIIVGGDLLPRAIHRDSAVAVQRRFVEDSLAQLLLDLQTTHPSIGVYLLPGNDDWAAAITALDQLALHLLCFPLHGRVYPFGSNTWIAGYACVPLTPFSMKDFERPDTADQAPPDTWTHAYTSERGFLEPISNAELLQRPTIATELAQLAQHSPPTRTIYVCHTPPYNSALDLMRTRHIGSRAMRRFIEAHTPPLTLHGHVHESPRYSGHYAERIGATWCINPGHDETRFSAVLLDSTDIEGSLEHTIFGKYAS